MPAGTGPGPWRAAWPLRQPDRVSEGPALTRLTVLTGCVPISEALTYQNLGFAAVTSQLMVNETRGCRERSDRLPRSLTSTWPVVEAGVAPRCCEGVAVVLCSVGTWAHLPLPHDSWEGACLMQSPGGGTATQADTHSPCSSVCMSISFSVLAKSPSPPLRNGPGTPREGLVPLGDLCP